MKHCQKRNSKTTAVKASSILGHINCGTITSSRNYSICFLQLSDDHDFTLFPIIFTNFIRLLLSFSTESAFDFNSHIWILYSLQVSPYQQVPYFLGPHSYVIWKIGSSPTYTAASNCSKIYEGAGDIRGHNNVILALVFRLAYSGEECCAGLV